MQISKRDFLKQLGLGAAAFATGAASADEYVPDMSKLPAGSCGDPQNVWFGKHIFPLEPTQTDGPSCFLKDGKVCEPAKELSVFHETEVVVVGGGPAGFAAAVSAARAGAKVALVERYGSLGGLFRLICPCFMTGQAAGIAAAVAVARGVSPQQLAFGDIAAELDHQRVYREM